MVKEFWSFKERQGLKRLLQMFSAVPHKHLLQFCWNVIPERHDHRESGMLQILRYSPNVVISVKTAQNVFIKSAFYLWSQRRYDAPCCQRVVVLFASQPLCARVLLDNPYKLMQASCWSRCCLKSFQLNSAPIFCLFGSLRWRVASSAMPPVHKEDKK